MSYATKAAYLAASSGVAFFLGYAGNEIRKGMELDPNARGLLGWIYDFGNLFIALVGNQTAGLLLIATALFAGIYAAITILRSEII